MSKEDDTSIREGVEIEDVAHAGDGVGHLGDGRVIFVPRTLPGEVVDVRIVEEHSNFLRGEVERWRRRSDERRESDCPFYARCGGCQYWHTSYENELELKTQAARDVIARNYEGELPEARIEAAPEDRRYRTRTRFHRRRSGDEPSWSIGFFGRESHDLVEVDDCLVAAEPVNEARRAVEAGLTDVGDVELRVETADATSAVVTIFPGDDAPDDPPDSLVAFAQELERHPAIRGVRFVGEDRVSVGGDGSVDGDQVLAEVPVDSIRVPAGLFRQANPAVNRRLVATVGDHLEQGGAERVLELFCGVGNLSFPVSERCEALLGVEVDEVAVEMAETMGTFAGREDLAFLEADLSEGFSSLEMVEAFPFDAVLMDPPRGGADAVCRDLVESPAEQIVYVSCDPPALGRDLRILGEGGWRMRSMEMFDMFPRTAHVEVVAVLERGA